MKDAIPPDMPAALGRVQRKIEPSRQGHRPRAPIPGPLWQEAAALALCTTLAASTP